MNIYQAPVTANEVLRDILRSVLGDIDLNTVTRSMLAQAGYALAGGPGRDCNEAMDYFCRSFLAAHGNSNYLPATNGEEWLVSRLSDAKVVFDVGANVGEWSLMARKHMPHADIRAYEINPATAAKARESLTGSGVKLFEYGLGALHEHGRTTTITTYSRSTELTNRYGYPHGDAIGELDVPIRAGCHEMDGLERIDLLKIDVEGGEYDVLDGFCPHLANIEVIQFEYGRTCIPAGWLLKDMYELLSGYWIGKLYPSWVDFKEYHPEHEDFLGPNYVAVKKDRMDLVERLKKEGA